MIENNLGTILGESGRDDEAAAHFEKALRTKPDFLEGNQRRRYPVQSRIAAGASGQSGGSEEQLNEALRLNPNSAETHDSVRSSPGQCRERPKRAFPISRLPYG